MIRETSKAGRRAVDAGVRKSLLGAARTLFESREFSAVTTKQIAAQAGANPAMINYYFGGKQGLYHEMALGVMEPVLARIESLEADSETTLEGFIDVYTRVLAANPWWPNFIVREVLFGKGETREWVVSMLASRALPGLMKAIGTNVASGRFRDDLDPRRTVLSLLGMLVFPFLVQPMVKDILQAPVATMSPAALAAHTSTLLMDGLLAND